MKQAVSWLAAVFGGLAVWSGAAAGPGLVRGLAYGPDPHQRLDLLVPAAKGFPTVLFIHGGSLTSGDRADEDYRNVCAPFPGAGIACANVNYRLAPEHAWPIRHVRAGLPPFLFLIAEGEQKQPPVLKANRRFVEDARARGNWADYRVLPSRTHYSAIRKLGEPGDTVFAILRDFVRQFSRADRQ